MPKGRRCDADINPNIKGHLGCLGTFRPRRHSRGAANGRDDLIITTVDLGENVAISMAQGGFIKGPLGAQRL